MGFCDGQRTAVVAVSVAVAVAAAIAMAVAFPPAAVVGGYSDHRLLSRCTCSNPDRSHNAYRT